MAGRWRTKLCQTITAVVSVALGGCGSGETDAQLGHAHTTEDAAADANGPGKVLTANEATVDAAVAANDAAVSDPDARTESALPNDEGAIDASEAAAVDRPSTEAGVETSTVGKADAAVSSDAKTDVCSSDVCGSIGIEINVCPELTGSTINPVVVAVGDAVHLTSSAVDGNGDSLVFRWTATQGTFVDANAANTTFRCSMTGTATIALSVSDGRCDDGFDQAIQCN